jgi:hypothetical protein
MNREGHMNEFVNVDFRKAEFRVYFFIREKINDASENFILSQQMGNER